jgi:hypothetical protein
VRARLCAWAKSWHLWLSPPPEVMTGRARAYLGLAAAQNLALAYVCLAMPDQLRSASFVVAGSVMPFRAWGVTFAVVGIGCIIGLAAARRSWAFLGLAGSATAALMWLISYLVAASHGYLTTPIGPIVWAAMAGRDFVVCGQPMRSPLDPIIRRIVGQEKDRGRE